MLGKRGRKGLSFHQEPGYEKKEFRDKEDFQSFYMTLTSSGYKVM